MKLTKAANAIFGALAYGFGYVLALLGALMLRSGTELLKCGDAAKRRSQGWIRG